MGRRSSESIDEWTELRRKLHEIHQRCQSSIRGSLHKTIKRVSQHREEEGDLHWGINDEQPYVFSTREDHLQNKIEIFGEPVFDIYKDEQTNVFDHEELSLKREEFHTEAIYSGVSTFHVEYEKHNDNVHQDMDFMGSQSIEDINLAPGEYIEVRENTSEHKN